MQYLKFKRGKERGEKAAQQKSQKWYGFFLNLWKKIFSCVSKLIKKLLFPDRKTTASL